MTVSGDGAFADAVVDEAVRRAAATAAVRGADWRLGIVTAVGADGTVDVGDIRARRLADAYPGPAVGDVAVLTQNSARNWLAIGRTAASGTGAWTSYTPSWTAATSNPSVGNGTLLGRYHRVGRTIVCQINLVAGSTTTFGSGAYSFTIPFTAADAGCTYIGNAHLLSPNRWAGHFVISPGNGLGGPYLPSAATASTLAPMTGTTPVTLTSSSQIRITVVYEAAT